MSTLELEYSVLNFGILQFHLYCIQASQMAFLSSTAPILIVGTLMCALAYRFITLQRELRV